MLGLKTFRAFHDDKGLALYPTNFALPRWDDAGPKQAVCTAHIFIACHEEPGGVPLEIAPALHCTCGFYAMTGMLPMAGWLGLAFLLVDGFGRVVVHELGWRAEFCRLIAFVDTGLISVKGVNNGETGRRVMVDVGTLAHKFSLPVVDLDSAAAATTADWQARVRRPSGLPWRDDAGQPYRLGG